MTKQIGIGVCGLGTVGSGTVNVLQRNAQLIQARLGAELELRHVGTRREHPELDLTGVVQSNDVFAVAQDPNVDILVELIGGYDDAKALILAALKNGKHVVTANKALIAEHGNEIFAIAREHNVSVLFEAAVAGGIPVIKALREGLSANRIEWLAGIINGTGNFILTQMAQKGRTFEEALQQAQDLGYAEADPTFDVEGIDAAQKLMILAALAFGIELDFPKVYTEGISQVEAVDMKYAQELGYIIKHLGIARRHTTSEQVEIRVHPTLLPEKSLMANVSNAMNAVMISGDAVGPTLYYGAGAGAEPTASAVIADLVDVARSILQEQNPAVPEMSFELPQKLGISSIDEIESGYYLRLSAEDKSGVLTEITQQLSAHGISIEAMIQKEPELDDSHVPIVFITDLCIESKMNEALESIEKLDVIRGAVVRMRVDNLGAHALR